MVTDEDRPQTNPARVPMPARRVSCRLLEVTVVVLAFAIAGCGGGGDGGGGVETKLQAYLDQNRQAGELGHDAEVMDDGCTDTQTERSGLRLYECVVYPGGGSDPQTWNVAVDADSGDVVDASPK